MRPELKVALLMSEIVYKWEINLCHLILQIINYLTMLSRNTRLSECASHCLDVQNLDLSQNPLLPSWEVVGDIVLQLEQLHTLELRSVQLVASFP